LYSRFASDYLTDPAVSSGSKSTVAITAATAIFGGLVAVTHARELGRLPAVSYTVFAAFVAWVALRGFTPESASEGLRETSQWGSYLLAFAVAGVLFGSQEGFRTIGRVVVIGGLAQSALAALQLATGNVAAYVDIDGSYMRPPGTFPHAAWLAFFLAVCIIAIPVTEWKPSRQAASFVVIILGLASTFSRGAMVFVFFAAMVYAVFMRRPRIVGLALGGVAMAALVPAIRLRFLGEYNNGQLVGSYKSRGLLRDYAIELWRQEPLFGHGSASFFATYSPMRFNMSIEAHSDIFKLLTDQGLVGLVLYAGLAASVVVRILRSGRPALYPVAALITTLPIMGVFDVYYRVNTAEVMLWSLAGCAVAAAYGANDQASGDGVRRAGGLDRLTWPFELWGRHFPPWMRHND